MIAADRCCIDVVTQSAAARDKDDQPRMIAEPS